MGSLFGLVLQLHFWGRGWSLFEGATAPGPLHYRRYGDLDFCAGGSLLYYRHLILAALRKVPVLKPYVGIAWDLATRWEKAEPVQHRVPVPEPLAEALISLAWAHGWKRWCGVVLLCFFGIARAGEVFRCKRSDLLFPDDMMHESSAAFLLLRSSKTSYRQAARVQHLKINNYVVNLLRRIYLDADSDEDLFTGLMRTYLLDRHRFSDGGGTTCSRCSMSSIALVSLLAVCVVEVRSLSTVKAVVCPSSLGPCGSSRLLLWSPTCRRLPP